MDQSIPPGRRLRSAETRGRLAEHRARLEWLAGNAATLARTVAWPDFPEGLVVFHRQLVPGHLGLSGGTGHAIAAENGDVMGRVGVLVNVADCLFIGGPALVEVTALHEIAHALLAVADMDRAKAATADRHDVIRTTPPMLSAMLHDPVWAAAFSVFVTRAKPFRPDRSAAIGEAADHQLRMYGYPGVDAVLEALGPVDDGEQLRPILASTRMLRLVDQLPAETVRAGAIAAAVDPRAWAS